MVSKAVLFIGARHCQIRNRHTRHHGGAFRPQCKSFFQPRRPKEKAAYAAYDGDAGRLFFLLGRRFARQKSGLASFFALVIIFARKALLCHTRFIDGRFGENYVGKTFGKIFGKTYCCASAGRRAPCRRRARLRGPFPFSLGPAGAGAATCASRASARAAIPAGAASARAGAAFRAPSPGDSGAGGGANDREAARHPR